MFTGITLSGVILVAILLFVFRSSVKKANQILPEAVDTALGTVAKSVAALDSVVTVNIIENDVELQHRIAEAEQKIKELGGIKDINALYRQLHS